MPFVTSAPPPTALAAALEARGAEIRSERREGRRTYLLARSPDGPLFARYSSDPGDVEVFAHEEAVRALVGTSGPLRAPPVLERGPGWLLEVAVEAEPFEGHGAIDAAVAAAGRLAELELPEAPTRTGLAGALRRRLRIALSPVPKRDLLAARRGLREVTLPLVTGHGDFYTGNLLLAEGATWVVDWELAGRWPAGYDLMRLWSTVARAEDRERLLAGAVELVGPAHRAGLLRLRHAVLVYTIAGLFGAERRSERDPAAGRELLGLLPAVRREAGL
jgi:hypothetical protein